MLNFHTDKGARFCDGLTRRDFLRAGALGGGALGLSLADLNSARAASERRATSCILLFLVGGPSHIDTWDPKPDAPTEIRGPFRPTRTNVTGVQICEHFPRMAQMADRYAIVRSVHHREAPIHETGQQLMQTGRLCAGDEQPHIGAVVSRLRGPGRGGLPPFVVLPKRMGDTGVNLSHGQGAGFLGAAHEPFVPGDTARGLNADLRRAFDIDAERAATRERYGPTTFGRSCLRARRLVEHGVRLVTVNMFDTVFGRVTWDCHADGGTLATTLDEYRDTLCPMFDRAYAGLLDDLRERGLLDTTLVVATGEFGRTPRLNSCGGRDHWPGVWSMLLAGGGVRGGQVVGASDRHGTEPRERPVTPAEVAATVYHALGVDVASRLGVAGRSTAVADAGAVRELLG